MADRKHVRDFDHSVIDGEIVRSRVFGKPTPVVSMRRAAYGPDHTKILSVARSLR